MEGISPAPWRTSLHLTATDTTCKGFPVKMVLHGAATFGLTWSTSKKPLAIVTKKSLFMCVLPVFWCIRILHQLCRFPSHLWHLADWPRPGSWAGQRWNPRFLPLDGWTKTIVKTCQNMVYEVRGIIHPIVGYRPNRMIRMGIWNYMTSYKFLLMPIPMSISSNHPTFERGTHNFWCLHLLHHHQRMRET